MAFDIDKMKADGVSPHLIELASMEQETFLLLIARRLEHDKLFQQFMGENAGSIETMYPYAVAAGLMSEEDRKWLIDEENPYKPQGGEIWYTGTLGECEGGFAYSEITETDKANTADLVANPTNYVVIANGTTLQYLEEAATDDSVAFADDVTEQNLVVSVGHDIQGFEGTVAVVCPTDITDIEITVAHK